MNHEKLFSINLLPPLEKRNTFLAKGYNFIQSRLILVLFISILLNFVFLFYWMHTQAQLNILKNSLQTLSKRSSYFPKKPRSKQIHSMAPHLSIKQLTLVGILCQPPVCWGLLNTAHGELIKIAPGYFLGKEKAFVKTITSEDLVLEINQSNKFPIEYHLALSPRENTHDL